MNKILDIEISFDRLKIKEKYSTLLSYDQSGYIATVNSNILVNAYKNENYHSILKKCYFNICDGSVLTSALNFINKTKYNSYPGPDFFMDRIKEKIYTHAFLGSSTKVLEELKKSLSLIDDKIKDAIFLELPFLQASEFNYKEIGKDINANKPDFIWVSLGAPKQELFASYLLSHINRGLIVPVGAAFDFYANNSKVARSPKILIKLRLEWLYRLYKQPSKTYKRLKNEFFYMPIILFKEILKKKA